MKQFFKFHIWMLLLSCGTGFLAGTGIYTFYFAEGASYISNDPEVCVNCHIMKPQYDSWQKASHHAAATCNDCHVPHDLMGKYFAKAENGYHHSKAFTLGNFHEPIMIKPQNASILEANCRYCHQEIASQMGITYHNPADKIDCVRCHQSVGHGPRK